MRIAFRVDASKSIGYGHFMRCLTLANSFDHASVDIMFICRDLPLHLQKKIIDHGYLLSTLTRIINENMFDDLQHSEWLGASQKQDALESINALGSAIWDWIVVDHYGIDYRWESRVRHQVKKILVIDDLADRHHDFDMLIDQNLYLDAGSRYANLVSPTCEVFLGPHFAFLRPEFHELRKHVKVRSGKIQTILIYFGGIDSDNITLLALNTLIICSHRLLLSHKLHVDVVIGAEHPSRSEIESICLKQDYSCYVQTDKMADLMANADLAIGAGGISTYERLYLRLPAILKATSFNQLEPLTYMSSIGLFELFESSKELEQKLETALLRDNVSPPDCVENGNAKLITYMMNLSVSLRSMSSFDVARTFKWLQNKQLRDDFETPEVPQRSIHFKYWRNILTSEDNRVYAIYYIDKHVGNCGLKNINIDKSSCELWIYIADISARGKGLAKNSVLNLITKAKYELSCSIIYLHVSKSNFAAIRLYNSTGFNHVNELLKEPWANREDIQKMTLMI